MNDLQNGKTTLVDFLWKFEVNNQNNIKKISKQAIGKLISQNKHF